MGKRAASSKTGTKIAKRVLAFLMCMIFAPLSGCLLGNFWVTGGNIFWEPIHYFPFPVEDILLLEPFGDEFWVQAVDNKLYHIVYPCESGQGCWDQVDVVPEKDLSYTDVDYRVTEKLCRNDSIAYPLFRKIKICITSIVPNESPWTVSLALTEDQDLWIWQKPWDSPYNVFAKIVGTIFFGAIFGLVTGIFWAWKIK
jgi:hypothetical protein